MSGSNDFFKSVDDAISFLWKQDVLSRKSRTNLKTSLAVQVIERTSQNQGLNEDQLLGLIDLACSRLYGDAVSSKLVKSLIPKNRIPSLALVKAISWISTNKLSISLQALLVRWILVVYQLLDDITPLQALYGVLFLFLESDVLCPLVCQLLSYITRKEDVKRFRIKRILNLQNRVGTQAHLNGLLSIYKMHASNLVAMTTSVSKVWFKKRDSAWSDKIWQVQEKQFSLEPVNKLFLEARLGIPGSPAQKKRKAGHITIPSLQCSSMSASLEGDFNVTIKQLESFSDLVANIDRVELPSQIASVLESPFLQHVISCNPSYVTLQRLNFWLSHTLFEEFLSGDETVVGSSHARMLLLLIQLGEFIQESVPAVEMWLGRYLFSWSGAHHRPLVLKLITQISLQPFAKLYEFALEPLRKLFFSSPVYFKCQVMYCLTELLRNFVLFELPRHEELSKRRKANSNDASSSLFLDEEMASFDPQLAIYEYIKFVDRLSAVALQAEGDHALLQHHVLEFFELVSVLQTRFQIGFVVIPCASVVYRLLFASNAMAVSRFLAIMVNYRSSFESLKKSTVTFETSVPDSFQSIQQLNQFILDTCDSMWRNKAFVNRDGESCYALPGSVRDNLSLGHINEAFTVHNHVAMVGFAWKFLHETQPEDLPLNPRLIKGRVRHAYMEYLRRQGLLGIHSFMKTFIRHKI
ncbi:predicted protein [Nematostella vectensis]|uniref:Centromere protein I n=1 Tax=Nematostella vectensis TaxID=45351 RepID=A7RYH4_NEMVE|nr:predicted protein [Nematostella vectensis]|eukprot:XP_001635526.1 predicted protein [Nematostella vectensis]